MSLNKRHRQLQVVRVLFAAFCVRGFDGKIQFKTTSITQSGAVEDVTNKRNKYLNLCPRDVLWAVLV